MKLSLTLVLAGVAAASSGPQAASDPAAPEQPHGSTARVVLTSDVEWQPLNPARGDNSPRAATLWGDRQGTAPTGFLVKFADGFSSPAHIHNVSYRGVVISGLIHNDDPGAAAMWMPTGSFWTQPKGEEHITAARGGHNLAYIEIEQGPYLVLPAKEAFDSGERPINAHASNLVWLDTASTFGGGQAAPPDAIASPELAFLWGELREGRLNGTLVRLAADYAGELHSRGSTFRAVVIQGQLRYRVGDADSKTLDPGSHFASEGEFVHRISSAAGANSVLYVRTDGRFEFVPQRLEQ